MSTFRTDPLLGPPRSRPPRGDVNETANDPTHRLSPSSIQLASAISGRTVGMLGPRKAGSFLEPRPDSSPHYSAADPLIVSAKFDKIADRHVGLEIFQTQVADIGASLENTGSEAQ